MDPMPEEQFDFEEEEYGGPQKMQYYGGAISALAEDDLIGEDDEYDDLYGDLNVGKGFLHFQQSMAPGPSANGAVNGGFQTQKTIVPEPRPVNLVTKESNINGVPTDEKYTDSGVLLPDSKGQITAKMVLTIGAINTSQKAIAPDMSHNAQTLNLGFHGSTHVAQNTGIDPVDMLGKVANESVPLLNPGTVVQHAVSQMLPKHSNDNVNVNRQIANDNPIKRTGDNGATIGAINTSQKAIAPDMSHNAQALNLGFHGSTHVAQNTGIDPVDMLGKVANESVPLLNPGTVVQHAVSQMLPKHSNDNVNVNRQIANDNPIKRTGDNGATMLFVGELHWWTTDAEIESVSSKYGRVKEIKFFDEKASGKSKGCCQVEFYDSAAAAACKEGMNGYNFSGRACTVAFASPHTSRQMDASSMNKSQVQPQSQSQLQGRRPMRGVGGSVGPNNKPNSPRVGAGANAEDNGQGTGGPAFGGPPGGSMHPQGIMDAESDPTYMGRGSGYGGFADPAFPGTMPPFPNVNAMGISGVSPHANPAFFGRGMSANGMGMMGNAGMDGPHLGMWNDTNMGGWGSEEHGQRRRELSYGGEEGGSKYGYKKSSHDKGPKSNAGSREKERASERDWSGNSDKRQRDERNHDRERYDRERYDRERYDRDDRERRYREEKDDFRKHQPKYRVVAYKDDWDRGQTSSRSRSRSRVIKEDHRSRSRDADYWKRSAYCRTDAF